MSGRVWNEPACTGNCNQGRACDCVADSPEVERPAMTANDAMTVLLILVVSWAVICIAACGIGYLVVALAGGGQ